VPEIAGAITAVYGGTAKEMAWNREFRTFHCMFGDTDIIVTSTGIGGPSTSIPIEELAMLGIDTFIRVGTTGAIQNHIEVGDVIITNGSVRLDGASTHYAPIEYPAVAHHEIVRALITGASETGISYHVGITVSSDTFYPGQERDDSFSRYVLTRHQGSLKEWQQLKVLNVEMESSTVLTLTASMGLRGGCVSGVLCSRIEDEHISDDALKRGETNAVEVAVASIKHLYRTQSVLERLPAKK
jgi:uridine phosphorylase